MLEVSNRLSKTIKSMIQLKPSIVEFMRCDVGNGESASFWYDAWTDFGQLLTFLGAAGPRQLRIRQDARVVEASRNGDWFLPAARSDNSQLFLAALTMAPVPHESRGQDSFLWRNAAGSYLPSFSSRDTWEQIRVHSPTVPWAKVVWFKEYIPRFSLITWMSFLERLPTRDRLRGWGMNIPSSCVLCSNGDETHAHLFFECSFSLAIWEFFASKFRPSPPFGLPAASSWILQLPLRSHSTTILKLLLQSAVYHVWKERNARIFTSISSSASSLRLAIDRTMRNRLLSFPSADLRSPSLLQFYFSRISYPV